MLGYRFGLEGKEVIRSIQVGSPSLLSREFSAEAARWN